MLGVASRLFLGGRGSGLLTTWARGAVGFRRSERGCLVCFLLGVFSALQVLLCRAVTSLDYGIIDIVN